MRKMLANLVRGGSDERDPACAVTLHRLHQLFEYGYRHNRNGLSLSEDEADGLARLIDWQAEPRDWTILVASNRYQIGNQIVVPPHIKWSNNPHFRYVGIVGGAIEYRSGDEGQSAYFLADVTTDREVMRQIDELFRFWSERLQLDRTNQDLGIQLSEFQSVTRETPINGFTVLSIIYPNHSVGRPAPLNGEALATLLAHSIDCDWFAADPGLDQFAVSDVVRGEGDNIDCHAFDFGPCDHETDEFLSRHTVIVRETAGGGFLLLIQEGAREYAAKITKLFEALGKVDRRTLSGRLQE